MKSLWKMLLLAGVVAIVITTAVTIAVVWSGGAAAAQGLPQGEFKISGTLESTGSIGDRNPKTDGSTLVMHSVYYSQVHGSFEGVGRADITMTIDTETGAMSFDGVGFFTGTLNGVAGTAVTKMSGTGQFMYPWGLSYTVHGVATQVGGTGGLANVRGSLSFDQKVSSGVDVQATVSYSGTAQVK